MKRYVNNPIKIFLALLIGLIFTHSSASAANPPRLRVLHAAPGLSNLDIYLSDTLFFENIFYTYLSDYAPANPGDQTIKVRPAGASPRDPTLLEVSTPYNQDQDYTVIAAGRQGDIQRWRLEDDNQNLPGTGTAKVRIVHAAFGTPTTEFCLADVCRTLAFQQDTGYFLMDPGTYKPVVRINDPENIPITIPPLVLLDNSIHTVFLVGEKHMQPRLELLYSFDAGEPDLNPHPSHPDDGAAPPPAYPPVSGAFLSPQLLGVVAGVIMIMIGGMGFWLTSRRQKS